MDTRASQIRSGLTVVGSDGAKIGEVKDVREDHIVVTGGTLFKHDLYIPIDHVAQTGDGKVEVSIPADLVDQEGWRYPPNAGYVHEAPAYPDVPDTTMIQASGYGAGRLAAPEVQGAVLQDGGIDPGELPNTDLEPDANKPGTLDDNEDAR